MTVLLLGDSSVARLFHEYGDLAGRAFRADAECRAVDGSWSGSLRDQVGDRVLSDYDCVALAIGSSDNHPDAHSSLKLFGENVEHELVKTTRWVALLPSTVAWVYEPFDVVAVNAAIERYADLLSQLVIDAGGIALNTREVAARLGDAAYASDGMHLSLAAFEALVPEIAKAIESLS